MQNSNKNIKNAIIFSDSRSVLDAIKSFSLSKCSKTSYIILDIISLLYNNKNKGNNITLTWIPSHCNIKDNEIIDSLAKNACLTGTNLNTILHHTDFTEKINEQIKKLNLKI